MASALSHHCLYAHTFHYHRPSYRHRHCCACKEPLKRSANFSARQSPEKHSIRTRNHDLPPSSSSSPLRRFREALKIDGISLDILSIALPAALALAADPLTSLVDSAFVGHLGAVELAAVGVSVSVFNLVSKLVNVPLLNITTSFVAEEQALISKEISISPQTGQDVDGQRKELLPSVSASLFLAAGIGFVQAVALYLGSGSIMNILGISVVEVERQVVLDGNVWFLMFPLIAGAAGVTAMCIHDSPIRIPAEQFLSVRAFGAPPIVVALAAQGTFRGFKDTKTPLYAIGSGNILNVMLDPILIFLLGFGITGAATATVISEYLIAFILLLELSNTFSFTAPNIDGGRLLRYFKAGGLLIARTIAVLLTMTLATSVAATQGPTKMAGHQICLEVWMAISLLTDAIALAGQALLADGYSQGNNEQARQVVYRVMQIGLLTGTGLAVVLFLGFGTFSTLFSTDPEVLRVSMSGLLFVAGSQPMTAIAFVLDGLYYGVSDFSYATYAMVISSLLASLFMVLATPALGLPGVWTGLFLFMTIRVAAGAWRLSSKTGPWKEIWSDSD